MMHSAIQIAWHTLAVTSKHIAQTLPDRAGCSQLKSLHDANSNAMQAGTGGLPAEQTVNNRTGRGLPYLKLDRALLWQLNSLAHESGSHSHS